MLKPVEKMHVRSKMVQIGMMCMGQRLVGSYRTLKDDETGKTYCMMMTWNGQSNSDVVFAVHETDEYLHLFFEDVPLDFEREHYLRDNAEIDLPDEIEKSKEFQKVYKQLFNGIKKKLYELGYDLNEDLSVS